MNRMSLLLLPVGICACGQIAGLDGFESSSDTGMRSTGGMETGNSGGADPSSGGSDPSAGGSDPSAGGTAGTGASGGQNNGGGSGGGVVACQDNGLGCPCTDANDCQGDQECSEKMCVPAGCTSFVVASGLETIIDDFEDGNTALIPRGGRSGVWSHTAWDTTDTPKVEILEGGTAGSSFFAEFSCSSESWCSGAWSASQPWQWAGADGLLADGACVDASSHTGFRFEARSSSLDGTFSLQMITPDADLDNGEIYRTEEFTLSSEWTVYSFPFQEFEQPSWSTVTKPLDPSKLQSVTFSVRAVEAENDGEVLGESLKSYQLHLDNVEFY